MRHVLISAFVFFLIVLQGISLAQNAAPAAQEPVLVRISKETTRITEPLKPSGYPDFLEAVNIAAKGKLAPEKNGLLLVLRAVGPVDVTAEQLEEFYRRLEIDPPAPKRREYVSYATFVEQLKPAELPKANAKERTIKDRDDRNQARRERVELEFDECGEIPWTTKDHPLVARWLAEQKESLAELDRLRNYPEAYLPYITGKQNRSLLMADNPGREMIRRVALDLRMRALNSVAERQYDAALDDAERLIVLRRYLLLRNDFIKLLTSNALRGVLHPVIFHLALSEDLTQKQAQRLEQLLKKDDLDKSLEPRLQLADLIDHHERLHMIEGVCRMAELGNGTDDLPESPKTKADVDYDFILKQGNAHYDRYVECLRIADPEQRQAAYDEFEAKLNETEKQTRSQARTLMLKLSRTGRSTLVAETLQSLTATLRGPFLITTAKSLTYYDLWKLSFALGEYRRKHGKFPAALADLVPDYLAKLPVEHYTDEPLKYHTDGKSLLLYSVGRDNEEHQGFEGNAPNDVFCDDLAVYTLDRRPQAPKPKVPPEFTDE